MSKKILLAIDDSENAMRAVRLISELFDKDSEITLYSALLDHKKICEYNSPSLTPSFQKERAVFCALEEEKKSLLEKSSGEARDHLMQAGFARDNIHVETKPIEKGVARDIIKKADSGYDVVVLGKRGISGASEFLFGSVSQKVLNGVKKASVFIVT